MPYLLDSNVFIQAKNMHYGFDFCPGFWVWLDEANAFGTVFSIDRVKSELSEGNDELATWAKSRGKSFFKSINNEVITGLARVSKWVNDQGFSQFAKSNFLNSADYYLIGFSLANNFTVVTHEVPSDSKNRIKIPNVCQAFGIEVMSPFGMLRAESVRFILDKVGLP